MYIPFIITAEYLLVSSVKHKNFDIQDRHISNVLTNLLITEVLYLFATQYLWTYVDVYTLYEIPKIITVFIMQDIWFYSVHRIFHSFLYKYHKLHHSMFGPFYAWYAHPYEHVFVNLLSIGIPIYLAGVHHFTTNIIIILQVYTSVNGHTDGSPHSVHHRSLDKRFGSIYLLDRLFGSF